ncbi:pyridoxal 5'-phosphate synthase glutaminase subunit PdxT [Prevotella disiens]|uniref:Pyridoxal 5'-phosphate synthase subunit PdxT n=4 Tax=Prevotella disiens TaxID=28130 RepID=A0A379DWU4_9BACT|nr:pyridoxal 5'-phosphate synthase glutaminase subunit PdxT [Prevotella disiens]EFL44888.1 pyridoxal 5'-phosphate synthase, glutaminase subunit Pdx2 [Prevotella disiens FB035-09AN]KGF46282.1 glutamine amidotransferase [Prevotella disiens DNF00882]RGL05316.1 pyridoxal 5'-phosphate synthase glutaminase subunit PdxT [Prevotella disiens]SUB84531.1 Glutamine amidotransferase subunit pdxT [Prevotella disiens]
MKIAILALQGSFAEHEKIMQRLGHETFEVRQASDWDKQKDGLIIPGGESTVMLKLLHELNLFEPIKKDIENGLPVYGTCAGLIILSKEVEDAKSPYDRFATMNISTCRNAYGRQMGSFAAIAPMKGIAEPVPMTFIRAPYIDKVGEGVEVLAEVDGHIVAARQGNQLVTAFHPELGEDTRIHELFASMLK